MEDEKRMQRLSRLLEPGLSRPPGVTVSDIKLPSRRKQLSTPVRALAIATTLIFVVFFGSLFNRDLARAIASIPGAGEIYQRAIINWNLQVAYELGLVKEFSAVIELPDATIEVFSSYSDALTSAVAFEVQAHDGDAKAIMDKYWFTIMPDNWLYNRLSSSSGSGTLGYTIFPEGAVAGAVITRDSLPWWWFWSVPFNVFIRGEAEYARVATTRIPVSRTASQTVRVNRYFDLTGAEVESKNVSRPFWTNQDPLIWVDRVIFTPVNTRIDYDSTRIMPLKWVVETDNGTFQTNGWSTGVTFPPLTGDNARFTLLSYQLYLGKVDLPLQQGAFDNSIEGVEVSLDDLEFSDDYTKITITVTSDRSIVRPNMWITVEQGQGNNISVMSPPLTDGQTITYMFPAVDPNLHEYVSLGISEELECNISFEVER